MDGLIEKYDQLLKALNTLEISLNAFNQLKQNAKSFNPNLDYEEDYRIHRDSVIQRFEYSIDLFWKYIKKYLESEDVRFDVIISREVIRKAYSLRFITEEQAETILEMIRNRNKTSHIYLEEISDYLIRLIPEYYNTLNDVLHKFVPRDSH